MHDNMLFNYNKKHMVLVPKIVLCHTQTYNMLSIFSLSHILVPNKNVWYDESPPGQFGCLTKF